jgi:hypothetical protein
MLASKATSTQQRKHEQPVSVGVSHAFHNKTLLTGDKRAFAQSFIPTLLSPRALARHITSGGAFTPAAFNDQHRKTGNFNCASYIGLDFDDCVSVRDILRHDYVKENGVFLVYATPSSTPEHPKSRAVFRLKTPISDENLYRQVVQGLMLLFADLKPDPACKDPTRLYFGSDQPGCKVNLKKALSPVHIDALYQAHAEQVRDELQDTRYDAPHAPRPLVGQHAETAALAYLDTIISDLAATPSGRHTATFNAARSLHGCVLGDWAGITPTLVENELLRATARNGWLEKVGEREVRRVITDAQNYAEAKQQLLPSTKRSLFKLKQLTPPELEASDSVALRYISDYPLEKLLTPGGAVVKSDIGTGKTELIKRLSAHAQGRVLVITHRRALSKNLSERLDFENYQSYAGKTAKYIRQLDKLVISLNSLWKLANNGAVLPHYDMVFIDEVEQVLDHFDSNTFRGNEAKKAYLVLRQLMTETHHCFGFDAHLGERSQAFFKCFIPDLLTVENTYTHDRGQLLIFQEKDALINQALTLIQADEGLVVVPISSKAKAAALAQLVKDTAPTKRVMVISSENSYDADIQDFIKNINQRLSDYDVLIYTPSLGTGVDITVPVRAVCGQFDGRHLSALEYLQMLGRCRHTQHTCVYVDPIHAKKLTDWQKIYTLHYRNALHTAAVCEFTDDGVFQEVISDTHESLLKLTSMCQAHKNQIINDQFSFFVTFAKASGYSVHIDETSAPDLKAALKAAKKAVKERKKKAIFEAAAIDHDTYKKHETDGTITPTIHYGYERFRIEDTVGLPLDDDTYRLLNTPDKRATLRNLADVLDTQAHLKAADRYEIETETLVNKRRHHTTRAILARQVVQLVWGTTLDNVQSEGLHEALTAAEISQRLEDFIYLHERDIHAYFGNGRTLSMNPVAIVRRILKYSGVRLRSDQVRQDGQRIMIYELDVPALHIKIPLAQARLRHIQQKRQQASQPDEPAVREPVGV